MRTLLLADDSVTVQRVIALTFAEEQIRVVTVADGQQAIEKLAALKPDIVLAGTQLPQVSGYDLAKFMRAKPDLQHVPVLLLSGAFETVDDARLKSSGANGVIEKPVEPTVVIGRVKELLGMKVEAKPPASGRLVTAADGPGDRKLPVATPPRAVTSTRNLPSKWDQLRNQTGLDANTRSVEDASTRTDDYLDTLDAAFDTLDQQLSGRLPAAKPARNPSGPLGQAPPSGDPRSPGRRSANGGVPPGNPVFEVDDEWFGDAESPAQANARAGRREIAEDLQAPELAGAPPVPSAIYEVDDEWFAEDQKARSDKAHERQRLADEMGIHDVDLQLAPSDTAPAASAASDFDFGLKDIEQIQAPPLEQPPEPPAPPARPPQPAPPAATAAPPPVVPEPRQEPAPEPARFIAPTPQIAPMPSIAPVAAEPAAAPTPAPAATPASAPVAATPAPAAPPVHVADDFAALLAFEQGDRPHPPMAPAAPPEIRVVAPEITPEMLDQIAARVADRLSASAFGDWLKDAMTDIVRDTVRTNVSETSERLVREEIERIKSRNKS